jgi:hypothetical protein
MVAADELPWYRALPNAKIGKKMKVSSTSPTPNPAPLPKFFARLMYTIKRITTFINGTRSSKTHPTGLPAILNRTTAL